MNKNKIVKELKKDDSKKDLVNKLEECSFLAGFQEKLIKLVDLGKEIENNLYWQNAFIWFYFDSSEDNIHSVVEKMTQEVFDEKITNSERVKEAHKILKKIADFKEMFTIKFYAKQATVNHLIPIFENTLEEINFDVFKEKNAEIMKSRFNDWFNLSKELVKSHEKAMQAIEAGLEMDEMFPIYIVQNNGNIKKNVSSLVLNIKKQKMVNLKNEADEIYKRIEDKRLKISEKLFGKPEEYIVIEDK